MTFLRAAAFLQAEGVKIGDYNPQNFRFDPARRQLGFIDTDAFQVRHNGGLYVCPVTSPEMTPPELLNEPVKRRWRSPANEIFPAALLTFLILMPGKHPFEARQADDAEESLRKGGFPYRPANGSAGAPTGLVPEGIWGRVWDHDSRALQCTLLLVAIGRLQTLWLQVGGGDLVFEEADGALRTARTHGREEDADVTCTIRNALELPVLPCGLIETARLKGIAAFSDGAGERLIFADGQEVATLLRRFWQALREERISRLDVLDFLRNRETWRKNFRVEAALALFVVGDGEGEIKGHRV